MALTLFENTTLPTDKNHFVASWQRAFFSRTPSQKARCLLNFVLGGCRSCLDTWCVAVGALVARVEQVLGRAHGLFGDPVVSGGSAARVRGWPGRGSGCAAVASRCRGYPVGCPLVTVFSRPVPGRRWMMWPAPMAAWALRSMMPPAP